MAIVLRVANYLQPAAVFEWPVAPRPNGSADLQVYTDAPSSSAYAAHLMDPSRQDSFFVAYTPAFRLAFGYVWKQVDFPWMGIWEEHRSRSQPPWSGQAITRGIEFGVSPFPETRRQMIGRGSLFDVPTYRWIPAQTTVGVEYWIIAREENAVPAILSRGGIDDE